MINVSYLAVLLFGDRYKGSCEQVVTWADVMMTSYHQQSQTLNVYDITGQHLSFVIAQLVLIILINVVNLSFCNGL